MPRLNFSMDDNYTATPIARPAPLDASFIVRRDHAAKSAEQNRRPRRIAPLFVTLAVAMIVLAAGATLLATGTPIHPFP